MKAVRGVFRVDAETSEALDAAMTLVAPRGRWIGADAALGSWRPNDLACQVDPDAARSVVASAATPLPMPDASAFALAAGTGIDAESQGDRAVEVAAEIAELASTRLEEADGLVVVAPRFRMEWAREDLVFLRLLADRLRGRTPMLFAIPGTADLESMLGAEVSTLPSTNSPSPPTGPLVLGALVPGTLSPEIRAELRLSEAEVPSAVRLAEGTVLVAPCGRVEHAAIPRRLFDLLAVRAAAIPWLAAYAQAKGHLYYVDVGLLARVAWHHFGQGAPAVALRLLDTAGAAAADDFTRAVVAAQAQGVRIASGAYRDAGGAFPVPAGAPEAVRRFIELTRAWGGAMTGETTAERELGRLAGEQPPGSAEEAYALNIWALARLRSGDERGAAALEERIERRLAEEREPDPRLVYVNALNLGRLERRRGDLAAARQHFERAFATSDGLRSTSDLVFMNATCGRMFTETHRATEALDAWLRACLHYLAWAVPESLAPRAARFVAPGAAAVDLGAVAAALAHELRAAAAACPEYWQLDQEAGSPALGFRRAGRAEPETTAYWSPGIGVLWEPVERPPPRGRAELASVTSAVLRARARVPATGTVVVDEMLGHDVPRTLTQLASTAVRVGASAISTPDADIPLESHSPALESAAWVRMGVAVVPPRDGFAKTATLRRYRPPVTLDRMERDILSAVCTAEARVSALVGTISGGGVGVLRSMEERRLIEIEVDEHDIERLVSGRLRA